MGVAAAAGRSNVCNAATWCAGRVKAAAGLDWVYQWGRQVDCRSGMHGTTPADPGRLPLWLPKEDDAAGPGVGVEAPESRSSGMRGALGLDQALRLPPHEHYGTGGWLPGVPSSMRCCMMLAAPRSPWP